MAKKRRQRNKRLGSGGPSPRGDNGLREVEEARMLARAVREGWVGPRWRTRATAEEIEADADARGGQTLIDKTLIVTHKLIDSPDERSRWNAAKIVVAMESQNQSDEQHADPKGDNTTVNVGVSVSVGEIIQRMNDDPDYIEYLRQRAVAEDCNAGYVRESSEQRPLEDGAAPGIPGPSLNGHHSGS